LLEAIEAEAKHKGTATEDYLDANFSDYFPRSGIPRIGTFRRFNNISPFKDFRYLLFLGELWFYVVNDIQE